MFRLWRCFLFTIYAVCLDYWLMWVYFPPLKTLLVLSYWKMFSLNCKFYVWSVWRRMCKHSDDGNILPLSLFKVYKPKKKHCKKLLIPISVPFLISSLKILTFKLARLIWAKKGRWMNESINKQGWPWAAEAAKSSDGKMEDKYMVKLKKECVDLHLILFDALLLLFTRLQLYEGIGLIPYFLLHHSSEHSQGQGRMCLNGIQHWAEYTWNFGIHLM